MDACRWANSKSASSPRNDSRISPIRSSATPRVGDQEWAKRERMVAFAGYPLLVGGELHGVLAMFSRERLTDSTLAALALVSNSIAVAVQRREASAERERLLVASQEAREVAERSSRAKDEFIARGVARTAHAADGDPGLGPQDASTAGLDKEETAEAVEVIQRNALAQRSVDRGFAGHFTRHLGQAAARPAHRGFTGGGAGSGAHRAADRRSPRASASKACSTPGAPAAPCRATRTGCGRSCGTCCPTP